MAWVHFEPGFSGHPKRLACDEIANWLWVKSVDYCRIHNTDGVIAEEVARQLLPHLHRNRYARARAALLKCTSWERKRGALIVHDFLHYQDSAEEIREQREASKQRVRAWRTSRQSNGSGAPGNDVRTPLHQAGNAVRTDPSIPTSPTSPTVHTEEEGAPPPPPHRRRSIIDERREQNDRAEREGVAMVLRRRAARGA
jgi:hypothetical protein